MMAKIMDVNDEEAFQMTLDDIIRLQDQRSRQNQKEANLPSVSGEVRNNQAVFVPNATLDQLLEARLNNTSRNGGNVGNGGSGPHNGGSLFNGGNPENGFRGGGGVSTNGSVFDEYANEPYDYPLSRGRGGASIIERQHGLSQNNYAGRRNHHNFRHNNNFKEAQLRAKRGLNMTNGSCCPFDSSGGQFQHHSRSRSRGPPNANRYRSQSRGRSRSRNRSRSRSRGRSQSQNRFGNVVILKRKDQVYNLEIQEEMSVVDRRNATRTPMVPYPHDPEKCEPEIDHTFMTLSMRFNGYYE